MSSAPLVVVGAGIQGLTFALHAARRGRRVVVLERSPSLGGQARSFRYGRFVFDSGMHGIVTSDDEIVSELREVLGGDFRRFRADAASWLGPGRLVRDEAARSQLFQPPAGAHWNCMRVVEPPLMIYPRRGGFATLCVKMAARLRRLGGRVVTGFEARPDSFVRGGGRLRALKLGGRRMPVAGVFWGAEQSPRWKRTDTLLLCHFLAKGRAPVSHHWVRIGLGTPMLPSIVYYPSAFSSSNVPAGHYSVGAALPLPARAPDVRGGEVLQWLIDSPQDFAPWIRRFLERAGLLRARGVIEARIERVALPVDRPIAARMRRPEPIGPKNLWTATPWLESRPGESLVPAQMRAARRACETAMAEIR